MLQNKILSEHSDQGEQLVSILKTATMVYQGFWVRLRPMSMENDLNFGWHGGAVASTAATFFYVEFACFCVGSLMVAGTGSGCTATIMVN